MKSILEKNFNRIFAKLCCSQCKNDFTKDSFEIIEQKGTVFHCRFVCQKCGKDFGDIILNINPKSKKHLELEIIDGAPPINYDDVIDAHEFIKKNL